MRRTPRVGFLAGLVPSPRLRAERTSRSRRRLGFLVGLVLALLAGSLAFPGGIRAQRVVVERGGGPELDRRIALILAGDYLLIATDTLIGRGNVVPGSVLVLDATLTLEGTVAGDLVGVDANLFLRPGARVDGDVVNVAGGLYPSALAEVHGAVVDRPLAPYRVERADDTILIEARPEGPRIELSDFKGFRPPSYDRVDALGLRWGAGYRLPASELGQPRVDGWIGYLSGRGAWHGGLELALDRGRTRWAVGGADLTATNEEWIRGRLRNSVSFLINGNDYRNYYNATRFYVGVERRFGREPRWLTASLRGRSESAQSLAAGDPWTLTGGEPRPNPRIDDGVINSILLTAVGGWVGESAAAVGDGALELAGRIFDADFSFGRFVLHGEWAMEAFSDHTAEVEWYFQGPLPGTRSLPRQRWSFIGGSGTLNTFEIGRFLGDRVVFVESAYIIPLPERLALPLIGAPDLRVFHAFGMAWTAVVRRSLEQNIGLRLQFLGPFVRVVTNPAEPFDHVDVDVGLSWPLDRGYPWQRPQ